MLGFRVQGDVAYANEEDMQVTPWSAALTLDVATRHHCGWALTTVATADFTIALTGARMFQVGYIALKQDATGGRNCTAFTIAGFTLGNPDMTGINTAAFKTANVTSVIRFQCLQVAGSSIFILNAFVGK